MKVINETLQELQKLEDKLFDDMIEAKDKGNINDQAYYDGMREGLRKAIEMITESNKKVDEQIKKLLG